MNENMLKVKQKSAEQIISISMRYIMKPICIYLQKYYESKVKIKTKKTIITEKKILSILIIKMRVINKSENLTQQKAIKYCRPKKNLQLKIYNVLSIKIGKISYQIQKNPKKS